MGGLKKPRAGYTVVAKGAKSFGAGVTLTFDKTLRVTASASDCLDFVGSALRDWYAEAHRTGQRFDTGLLPRDSSGWVAYESGLLSGQWRMKVDGDDTTAKLAVWVSPPDQGRRLRLAVLAKQGIRLSGLAGKALDIYTHAFATYMADNALVAE